MFQNSMRDAILSAHSKSKEDGRLRFVVIDGITPKTSMKRPHNDCWCVNGDSFVYFWPLSDSSGHPTARIDNNQLIPYEPAKNVGICNMCESRPGKERGNMMPNYCDDCFDPDAFKELHAAGSPCPKCGCTECVCGKNTWNSLEAEINRALKSEAKPMRITHDGYEMLLEVAEIMLLPEGSIPTREAAIAFLRAHVSDCLAGGILAPQADLIVSPLAMLSLLDAEFVQAYKICAALHDEDAKTEAEGANHAEETRS